MTWQNFPMITCPHCNQEFQVDDYYELTAGDTFDCAKCEREIHIWAADWILSGDIQALSEEQKCETEYTRGLTDALELHTRTNPGGCKMLSVGDRCECFLCQMDDLLNEAQKEASNMKKLIKLEGELQLRPGDSNCPRVAILDGDLVNNLDVWIRRNNLVGAKVVLSVKVVE